MSDDQPQPSVPVPPDFDEDQREAYLLGARAVLDLYGHATATFLRGLPDPDADPDAAADEAGECRTCGAPTRASMGAKETAHSPAGRTCIACEA